MEGGTILFFQIYLNLYPTVSSVLEDIDADVDFNALKACDRFGRSERTTKWRKRTLSGLQ